jgi:hypothetical protein
MRLARRDRAHRSEEASTPATASDEAGGARPRRTLRATRVASTEEASDSEQHPPPEASQAEEPPPTDEVHHQPAPEEQKSRKGRIRALFDEQVAQSREEAERDAAMELRQFMEPARQQLLLNVPGSSSPEEAEAMLTKQAATVLEMPVEVRPETVVDLRNPSSMSAYPPAEKLSNRVLRLADRHWAKDKRRSSAEIMANQAAINEEEFARRPVGTQRCLALRGSIRCRGVFAYHADDLAEASLVACPSCGTSHSWDPEEETWMLGPEVALPGATKKSALSSPT